ncbi:hypothetical protein K469DRAFT_687727 [Zopfia rhizophila CBS 207.26]|uniref:Uncharacterized protein n=1 Tax=Zopfia rhizophila CBS 207.26 TaxID=1314779 RepID=A0A6A6E425_9PEZI|nr:hypothetical protein K469DRAFT_687727 [Zopfia rhizophila CBS 207.26]
MQIEGPYRGFSYSKIPNVDSAGSTFALDLTFEVSIRGGIELGFGFDVKVPDSKFRLDIAEFQNSSITGPNGTKIIAKPFRANVSDIGVSLVAGLKPYIPIGIDFIELVQLRGGPTLTLPNINTTVTQLASGRVGANCEKDGETDVKFKDAFKNLTHVEYNIGLGAGLQLELGSLGFDVDLFTKQIPLAIQCLAFQTEGTTTGLTFATAALASVTRSTSATRNALPTKNAASSSYTPSSALPAVLGRYGQAAIAALYTITTTFAIL